MKLKTNLMNQKNLSKIKEILIFNLRSTPVALKIRSAEDLFGDDPAKILLSFYAVKTLNLLNNLYSLFILI